MSPRLTNELALTTPALTGLLRRWDKGSRATREQILKEFVRKHNKMTAPELEASLGNGASLFLTRVTAHLRLSFMLGRSLEPLVRAIDVFLSSASGGRFLREFIEVGGVLTVLEVLTPDGDHPGTSPQDMIASIRLLYAICSQGRKFKELLCKRDCLRILHDLVQSTDDHSLLEECRILLQALGTANPIFVEDVQTVLLTLLRSGRAGAQRAGARALRAILGERSPDVSFVFSALAMLRSLDLQVQFEGFELLKALVVFGSRELGNPTVDALIGALRAPSDFFASLQDDAGRLRDGETQRIIPAAFPQQAAAAKLLSHLCTQSQLADYAVEKGVVGALLYAMSNDNYYKSQRNAGHTLVFFVKVYAEVEEAVRSLLGPALFRSLVSHVDTVYRDFTSSDLEKLKNNTFTEGAIVLAGNAIPDVDIRESPRSASVGADGDIGDGWE